MAAVALEKPLRPLYPSFPERGYSYVNVLCEGRSILDVQRKHLLPGPTIAVNHAIALSSRLPIEFWAGSDDPLKLWDWAQPYLHRTAKIFSTENNIAFWLNILGAARFNRQLYAWRPTYMDHLGSETEKAPVLPTVATVLAWLAHLSPLHVRLFGCDMEGQNSPLSALPYLDEEEIGWEWRWEHERRIISIITRKYRDRGKRLDRWVRTRRSSRNLLSSWSRMQRQAK